MLVLRIMIFLYVGKAIHPIRFPKDLKMLSTLLEENSLAMSVSSFLLWAVYQQLAHTTWVEVEDL